MSSALIQFHDDALPPRLFSQLRRRVIGLGNERLRTTYQTTFWFDLRTPACVPELAALALAPRVPKGRRVVGVEWWFSRMRTTDVRVDFHRDRDNALFDRTGRERHPRWGSVLFLNRCRGGLLAVTREAPNDENPSRAPNQPAFDLAQPRPNRFVVFEGSLTHGVLDANNAVPTEPLPGHPPLRLAVIFNWWHRAPEAVRPWKSARVYRSLAI